MESIYFPDHNLTSEFFKCCNSCLEHIFWSVLNPRTTKKTSEIPTKRLLEVVCQLASNFRNQVFSVLEEILLQGYFLNSFEVIFFPTHLFLLNSK